MDIERMALLSEQRRHDLTTANDADFAFQLQIQEAIKASYTSHPSSSSSSSSSSHQVADSTYGVTSLLADEIDQLELESRDRKLVEAETQTTQENLNRLIHDQVFARQILCVREDEWRETGDYFEKPYGLSPASKEESFMVYFKGLVSDETVTDVRMPFAAIGVAICDSCDCCVFELGKPVVFEDGGDDVIDGDVVELKALFEALTAAGTLGLKRLRIYCDNAVYQYLTGKVQPTNNKIMTLLDQLNLIKWKFVYRGLFLVRQNNIKFAHKLAKDAIESAATKFAESVSGRTLLEECIICFESVYSGQMFSVNKCRHRYCFSCMSKHVEAKLLQGQLPACPHEQCKSDLEIESCKKFLSSKLYDIMSLRLKEASIPPADKFYCPFSNCSALMSKTEIQEYTPTSSSAAYIDTGMRKCVKCHRHFCIHCEVPWHEYFTCAVYSRHFPCQSANDVKLQTLATSNHWRKCIRCKNLVELSEGCYHIRCRCGYEFCYTCGAEWIEKKPTCRCPIWDERNIIYAEQDRR